MGEKLMGGEAPAAHPEVHGDHRVVWTMELEFSEKFEMDTYSEVTHELLHKYGGRVIRRSQQVKDL